MPSFSNYPSAPSREPAVVEPQEIASHRCSLRALCHVMLLAFFYLAPRTRRTCAVAHPQHDVGTFRPSRVPLCVTGSPQINFSFSIFKQASKHRYNSYRYNSYRFIKTMLFISFCIFFFIIFPENIYNLSYIIWQYMSYMLDMTISHKSYKY